MTCTRPIHVNLNEYQHDAVHAQDGSFVLAAAAGAGKTTVVTLRIEQLIYAGIDPLKIGAFTFGKDAAGEMHSRCLALGVAKDLRIGTIHSLCNEILRMDGHKWGGLFKFDDSNALTYALKEIVNGPELRDRGLDYGEAARLISLAKGAALSAHPDLWTANQDKIAQLFKARTETPWLFRVYTDVYRRFEEARLQRQLINYDDMLLLGWLTLVDDGAARAKWQARFDYLLIDESQDSSIVQNAVVRILIEKQRNVMLVGDPVQSIYRWRGAEPEEFVSFAREFTLKRLPVNYRSTRQICQSATALVASYDWNVTGATIPHDQAPNDPDSVGANVYDSPTEEASMISSEIRTLFADGITPGDVAILYRTTALLPPIEDALLKEGIPYVVWSGASMYERREVKDLLGYLRVAALRDPDERWVKRIIHVPARKLGKAYVQGVDDFARDHGIAFMDAVERFDPPKPYQRKRGLEFKALMANLNGLYIAGKRPFDILRFLTSTTQYFQKLKIEVGSEGPDPDSDKAAIVHQFLATANRFSSVNEFLDYMDAMEAAVREARSSKKPNAVVLSSIHRSKGQEWSHVYGIGWNDGTLPHYKNPDKDEEVRLAYVCLTRAKRRFRCSWTRKVFKVTGEAAGRPAPFIEQAAIPYLTLARTQVAAARR